MNEALARSRAVRDTVVGPSRTRASLGEAPPVAVGSRHELANHRAFPPRHRSLRSALSAATRWHGPGHSQRLSADAVHSTDRVGRCLAERVAERTGPCGAAATDAAEDSDFAISERDHGGFHTASPRSGAAEDASRGRGSWPTHAPAGRSESAWRVVRPPGHEAVAASEKHSPSLVISASCRSLDARLSRAGPGRVRSRCFVRRRGVYDRYLTRRRSLACLGRRGHDRRTNRPATTALALDSFVFAVASTRARFSVPRRVSRQAMS